MVRDPSQPSTRVPHGIDMTGEAEGALIRWEQTYLGEWIALAGHRVPYPAPRKVPLELQDQLVPGYAIRPRG